MKVYLINIDPPSGRGSTTLNDGKATRLDLQHPFTLELSSAGKHFQNVCQIMRSGIKNTTLPVQPLQDFCNTCLAFAGTIHLANWQVQAGKPGTKQNSYSAVLMAGNVAVPFPIFLQAHQLSARYRRRCYICVLPPEVVTALRAAGVFDKLLQQTKDAW